MSSKKNFDNVHEGATLRPLRIVKKHSAPLDQAIQEINEPSINTTISTPSTVVKDSAKITKTSSPNTSRRRSATKEKEKKRERWLLTRKTWKYMTEAGRKLIPEGAQNRKEDIPKVEAYFNQICAAEPRFILWKRKTSYPGAFRNSKRRFRQLLHHTCQKQSTLLKEREDENNVNEIINLLQSYLNLNESCKTTTLLGTKTVRPDKTHSPSAHRPSVGNSCSSSSLISQTPKDSNQLVENEQLLTRLRTLTHSSTYNIALSNESITPDILNNKVALKQIYNALKKQHLHRLLSKHSNTENINEFKANLKQSTSLSSLHQFSEYPIKNFSKQYTSEASTQNVNNLKYNNEFSKTTNRNSALSTKLKTPSDIRKNSETRKVQPPKTLDLNLSLQAQKPLGTVQNSSKKKHFNTFGTQTNFIQLQEIKYLAEEYKERKREEASIDDESEKTESAGVNIRRKSSIDNEDVSQSVSDTIKRYLRMARKKSIHDDQVNRFKRVNYDRNLRNIRAKGEINPPGMDEDNNKAVQTLDAWALIALEFIRGNENSGILDVAHSDWKKSLEDRIRKKLEYDQKTLGNLATTTDANCSNTGNNENDGVHTQSYSTSQSSSHGLPSPTSSTSPTTSFSPTNDKPRSEFGSTASNIIQSGSHFLSNLWHGTSTHGFDHQNTQTHNDETSQYSKVNSNIKKPNADPATKLLQSVDASNCASIMQKSKSSTNVGQFVSKKLLKSRSRSQTRSAVHLPTTYVHKWAPSDNFVWTSDNGDQICILDSVLRNLSAIESKFLQQVAIQKINELNLGLDIGPGSCNGNGGKIQKRHALQKKKALTTNLFDIGKKDDSVLQMGIFGNNLNACVASDRKRSNNYGVTSERESSIATLSRRGGGDDNSDKLKPNVRSCENLPSSTLSLNSTSTENSKASKTGSKIGSNYFGYLTKSALSRSQSDMRRKSQEFDKNHSLSSSTEFFVTHDLQVPTFITLCIQFLEEHGLHEVGLFRVSTSKKRVMQMKEEFDKRFVTEISVATCPHDVATLLKEFLRDLSEPLLCGNLYKAFLRTQKIRNRRLQLEAISHLIKLLPEAHRDTLYVLLKFLAKVATYSDDVTDKEGNVIVVGNKMDSNNLATVFAPNILKSTSLIANTTEQEVMVDAINVVRIMIDHYEELFRVSAELLDTVYANILDECPEKLFELCESRLLMSKYPKNMENIVAEHTPSNRRQSTPNVLNKSVGVVSASFKIPVSLQTDVVFNKKEDLFIAAETNMDLYNRSRKNSDIPSKEQEVDCINDCRPISGSSFFGSKMDTNSHGIHNILKSNTLRSPNVKIAQLAPTPNAVSGTSNPALKSNEPKFSTSISNIGETILRSKTQDFERKTQLSNHAADDKFSTNSSGKNQSQQLYKRQELIASSKRNRSHK